MADTKRLTFPGPRTLKRWLRSTKAGQRILEDTRCEDHVEGPPREPVLVVLRSDGAVIVKHERLRVTVKIVNRVHSATDGTAELLDKLVYLDTPRSHRHLHARQYAATLGLCDRCWTAEKRMQVEWELEFIAACLAVWEARGIKYMDIPFPRQSEMGPEMREMCEIIRYAAGKEVYQ